jgi:hypothetical protein
MKTITIPEYIFDNLAESIQLTCNIHACRKRETAYDRQVEYSERLTKWIKEGQIGDPPLYVAGSLSTVLRIKDKQ